MQWEDLVGPLLAERSFVSHVDQNVLFIGVTNSTWMQEFVILKQPLIDKLHERGFDKIKDLVFLTQDSKKPRKHKEKKNA